MNGNMSAGDVTSCYDALTNAAARNSNQSLISAGGISCGGHTGGPGMAQDNLLRNSHSGYSQNSNSMHHQTQQV